MRLSWVSAIGLDAMQILPQSMSFPELTDSARRVLKVLVDKNGINGGTLIRAAGMKDPSELLPPVTELQSYGLIEVSGSLTKEDLPFAYFGTRPSALEYLHLVLRQPPKPKPKADA